MVFHVQVTGEEVPHNPSWSFPLQAYVVVHFLLVLGTYDDLFEHKAVRIPAILERWKCVFVAFIWELRFHIFSLLRFSGNFNWHLPGYVSNVVPNPQSIHHIVLNFSYVSCNSNCFCREISLTTNRINRLDMDHNKQQSWR